LELFLKQSAFLVSSENVDMNRFYIKPKLNSAFKRVQPLPRVATTSDWAGPAVLAEVCAKVPATGSSQAASRWGDSSRIIDLERVRFE